MRLCKPSCLGAAGACIVVALMAVTSCSQAPPEDWAPPEGWAMQREKMVRGQIEARGVKDPAVLAALRKVERHRFVPNLYRPQSYGDYPLPIGEEQTISQPYIVGLMTELLEPKPGHRVLEVGTGSGYQAAILGEIVSEVYTIEIIESLGRRAEELLENLDYGNVHVRVGDGYQGWPEQAPFDGIMVTAAPDHVPQPLIDQLKVGGRLVLPVGESYSQQLKVIVKTTEGVETHYSIPVRFVPMTGEALGKKGAE